MKKNKNILYARIQTAETNANELFDYRVKQNFNETYQIHDQGYVIKGDTLTIVSSLDDVAIGSKLQKKKLGKASPKNDGYIYSPDIKNGICEEPPWIPIKDIYSINPNDNKDKKKEHNYKYILSQGDIIKFGRVEVKVREICLKGKEYETLGSVMRTELNSNRNHQNSNYLTHKKNSLSSASAKKTCRICFGEENDPYNSSPLINPCHCSGGVKYIHLSCLQKWLKTKMVVRSTSSDNYLTVTYKKKECEICNTVFPDIVQAGREYYDIWSFVKPEKFESYMIFENITTDSVSNDNHFKIFYILNFATKADISIGRSRAADLRIKDVSVSRIHAKIEVGEREVTLCDNNSKFGTIVLVQCKDLPILQAPLTVQYGKSIVTFWMKMKTSTYNCFLPCGSKSLKNKIINYNEINSKEINYIKNFTVKEENSEEKEEGKSEEEDSQDEEEKDKKVEDISKESDIKLDNTFFNDFEEDVEIRNIKDFTFNMREKNCYFSARKFLNREGQVRPLSKTYDEDKYSHKNFCFPSVRPQNLEKEIFTRNTMDEENEVGGKK